MENHRSPREVVWLVCQGVRLIRQAAPLSFSILASAAFVLAQLSRIGTILVAGLLVGAGIAQRQRATCRTQDDRYRKMERQLAAEIGFARLWIALGAALAVGGLLLPPILTATVGAICVWKLLKRGLAATERSVDAERSLGLGGRSPADECDWVRSLAKTGARVLRWGSARRFVEYANLPVRPGEFGVIQTWILAVLPLVLFAFVGLAAAMGISELAELPGESRPGPGRLDATPIAPPTPPAHDTENEEVVVDSPPTYAESCPEIRDPLEIGHHLGALFQRDGAPKAGCGDWAIEVPGTGAWVAAGNCEDELRSVAVYAPGHDAVLLYGEPARFAWSAALNGELVAAEAAEPEGGDMYLVETLDGTSGFARPSPSLEPGREEIELCSEATGTARPFAHLPPALAFLWLELVRDRTAWYWPENDLSDGQSPIAFVTPGGETVARGGCDKSACHLDVDGERWPGGETAFVSLGEFQPYMPPSAE
jgi:hypothetical protein